MPCLLSWVLRGRTPPPSLQCNRSRRPRGLETIWSQDRSTYERSVTEPSKMELSKKVKTALDETRMLILGAQVLLGFELRSAFSEGFDKLPGHAKHIEALALILMTISVALMIAPGLYHRIVEGGQDSGPFYRVATTISDLALLPFGLALGLDVFVSIEHVIGSAAGIASGIAASIVALAMWYGIPRTVAQRTGERERDMTERQRDERPQTPLHVKIEQMLTEARVILPGAQALFGFQLAIVLTQAFENMPDRSRLVHAIGIGLVALSIVLLMAPAAYHRIVYAGEDSQDMHRVGSALVTAATVPLALGLVGDVYVVITKTMGSPTAGVIAGSLALVLLIGLWHAYPLAE